MSKYRILSAILIVLLIPALAGAAGHNKVLDRGADGSPNFIKGDFGTLEGMNLKRSNALRSSAQGALQNILISDFGAAGNEVMIPTKVSRDELGAVHVRFAQEVNGLPVAGASMLLHAHADGKIYAVNGDFVHGGKLPIVPSLDSETALEFALGQGRIKGRRVTDPQLTYVRATDGKGHLAWQVTIAYRNAQGPQRDRVFASAVTGALVAVHPQIKYARSLQTIDCHQKTKNCNDVVSTSSDPISTGDLAIDSAHNFAIATYDYYFNNHGLDSLDGNGLTLISRVHFDRDFNNAFWDGTQMTYGDGDGMLFDPLSQDADVVAHELTHGVTEHSSDLIYVNESGALSEAWSDIFGAGVDRQEGASITDTWLLGEDIYTPAIPGDALRNMADPAELGDFDFWPTRFTGTTDSGGVHSNSGIANLAFVLLVEGGTHPQGTTSVVVPALHADFDTSLGMALDIFYAANNSCMTQGTNFKAARYCTAENAGSDAAAVHLAWDAVGVPAHGTTIALTDGVPVTGTSLIIGEEQMYSLAVSSGDSVTFTTSGNNGDADLYVRFGSEATTATFDCDSTSATSNESCTVSAPASGTFFASVYAWNGFTGLDVEGSIGGACDPAGSPCGNCCNGCSGGKPSNRVCL